MRAVKYVSILIILLFLIAPLATIYSVKAQENSGEDSGEKQTVAMPNSNEAGRLLNATKSKAEVMLKIAEKLINLAKARNINVTDLEGLLEEAKSYFNESKYNETIALCMHIMNQVRLRIREALKEAKIISITEGLRRQIEFFERYIRKLNEMGYLNATETEELMSKINSAKEKLSKGLINETAHILADLRAELKELSIKISEIA